MRKRRLTTEPSTRIEDDELEDLLIARAARTAAKEAAPATIPTRPSEDARRRMAALTPEVIAMRFVATRSESREAMKMLERDSSRDWAMVSSMNHDVAFVSVVWRDGWVTEFVIQRNGCSDAEMAAVLEDFAGLNERVARPATIQ